MMRRILFGVVPALLLAGCATARTAADDTAGADHLTLVDGTRPAEALLNSTSALDAPGEDFTSADTALITRAVSLANSITADTAFAAVLREMEAAREIDWGRRKRRLLPRESKRAPTGWVVGRFAAEGNYGLRDVGAGTFSYPPTTAMTKACVPFSTSCPLRTRLAPGYVAYTGQRINALANTLVHERVHSFGQIHGRRQTRGANLCDAAYVMGDLAESLLEHRAQGAPIAPRQVLCRALHRRLAARRIVA